MTRIMPALFRCHFPFLTGDNNTQMPKSMTPPKNGINSTAALDSQTIHSTTLMPSHNSPLDGKGLLRLHITEKIRSATKCDGPKIKSASQTRKKRSTALALNSSECAANNQQVQQVQQVAKTTTLTILIVEHFFLLPPLHIDTRNSKGPRRYLHFISRREREREREREAQRSIGWPFDVVPLSH